MKKLLIGLAIFIAAACLTVGGVLLYSHIYVSTNGVDDIPSYVEHEPNEYETVVAIGRGLYTPDGKRFDIKGINFGNLFILEGWMTTNSLGASYNEDGSFKSVNYQGIVEAYEEIFQEELDATLLSRVESGDFTQEQLNELLDVYFYSYCTEADFELLRDTGLNTIRLPVYYKNFMQGSDEALTLRPDAFEKLDYFLELAKKYELKVIVDMHGVVGGQSGFEHSGTRDMDFWTNEGYIESTCFLWKTIANHYVAHRPDLASTILAYDLVNEPTYKTEKGTGKLQWQVMDRLYDAIREVDEHHVISIEGVWYPTSLPSPEKYGWENVLYQYHFYNWDHDKGTPNELFYTLMYVLYSFSDYEVPKLVGEFNFFGDRAAWSKYLAKYDELGWGWTIWSYKVVSVGWWDSSWGVAVNKLNLQNPPETKVEDYKLKLDLRTASYEEIKATWSNEKTNYGTQSGSYKVYEDGTIYNVLKDYFGDKFKLQAVK